MKLKKELGFIDLFCVASGTMISSGIFILPGLVYLDIGPSAFVAYILGSFLIIPAMLTKCELATAMPKAGGTYFYIDRSMGAGFGTLGGFTSWLALCFKTAFALLGIGAFATYISPDISLFQIKLIASVFCIFFTVINLLSSKHASNLQTIFVFGLLSILVLFIGMGIQEIDINNLAPFLREGKNNYDLLAAAGLVFISYGGLTKIASLSEEVKNPARNIPLSMIASYLVVSTLYALVVFVAVGVLGDGLVSEGVATLTPISDSAAVFMGEWGKYLLATSAILAFISTGNAGILTASRVPMAMSRDNLLPNIFTYIHPKFKTPFVGILFTSGFMLIIILFFDLKDLVKTASTIMIMLFAVENIALIIMRESSLPNYRPKFKSPFYPWTQIAGILIYILVIIDMGVLPLTITGLLLALGLLWYWIYGRIHSNRASALVHLVNNIMAKEIRTKTLNSELKDILLERDEIIEDRFDKIIKDAIILDLKEATEMEATFKIIADAMSPRLNLSSAEIFELLIKRERETSTIISPGLAIPHLIL
ncbi:MAG: amino acid permease, partial [Verrucomicrobiota bacterium]|nr:amino acid permease [Verrucomicrobiota bacterium]